MHIIGVTGGIGTGKTIVTEILSAMGLPVYNSDAEAKAIMHTNSKVRRALEDVFGMHIYSNGTLNTALLARSVFSDPEKLQQLNDIVHPAVRIHFREWAQAQAQSVVILESAILFESGFNTETNATAVITAPAELRIKRVMERDKCSREEILQRISRQWTEEQKTALADFIIVNDEMHSLIAQTENMIHNLNPTT